MSLQEQIAPYIRAAFSGLWIQTWEPDEVVRDLAEGPWRLAEWDLVRGLQLHAEEKGMQLPPLGILCYFLDPRNRDEKKRTLVLLHNFHRLLDNPQLVQGLFNALVAGKADQVHYLVLSPSTEIPAELEKLFVVIEHKLPGPQEITKIAEDLVKEENREFKIEEDLLAAAQGMTRREVENALCLSLSTKGKFLPEVIWNTKVAAMKKKKFLSITKGGPGFKSLGGLLGMKNFARRLLRPDNPLPTKGLMLLGPAGTGKSAFCKALGAELGRPVITMDIGAMHDKHVGGTENNVREGFNIVDSMGRVILFIDECEKALSGVGSDGDSGVSTRVFGSILTWLSDREERGSEVFVVMTSNDISRLPPEFTRAERFDGVFFLDLPSRRERDLIWEMYAAYYKLPEKGIEHPKDDGWTGAEIKSCCRLAASLGLSLEEASQMVVPVSLSAEDKITNLRKWANGKVLCAETGKVFQFLESKNSSLSVLPRRKVDRQQP